MTTQPESPKRKIPPLPSYERYRIAERGMQLRPRSDLRAGSIYTTSSYGIDGWREAEGDEQHEFGIVLAGARVLIAGELS